MKVKILLTILSLTTLLTMSPVFSSDKVTLTIWAVDDMKTTKPQAAYAQSLVKNFQIKNPDIVIDWVSFDANVSDLNVKLKDAFSNNQGPDIFQSWGGSFMISYAQAGKLLDLTKELANISVSGAAKAAMSDSGKTYGVAPFFAIAGLLVNEGKFKELGIKIPTTVEEMEKAAEILKAKGIQPFAVGNKDKWPLLAMYMYLVNRYGGDIFTDAAVKRKVRFDSDPFVKAGLKIQEWSKKGFFGDKPLEEGYFDALQLMCASKACMQVTGSWVSGMYGDPEKTTEKIGFYPFPILSKGGVGKTTDVMGMTDIGFAATKTSETKKDAVAKFLNYAMTVEAVSAEKGRVCSVPGVKAPTQLTSQASELFSKAKFIQFWWDQNLPPTITGPVNDMIQSFMLPDTDVKKSLAKYEDLLVDNVGPIKK